MKKQITLLLLPILLIAIFLANCDKLRDEDTEEIETKDTVNYIALHDSSTDQYNTNCLVCHSDIAEGESLNANYPEIHVKMLDYASGDDIQEKCIVCHSNTDLLQHSAANIRRNVDVEKCAVCHGKKGVAAGKSTKQFYQR